MAALADWRCHRRRIDAVRIKMCCSRRARNVGWARGPVGEFMNFNRKLPTIFHLLTRSMLKIISIMEIKRLGVFARRMLDYLRFDGEREEWGGVWGGNL